MSGNFSAVVKFNFVTLHRSIKKITDNSDKKTKKCFT